MPSYLLLGDLDLTVQELAGIGIQRYLLYHA
jgi:hypothetical protein